MLLTTSAVVLRDYRIGEDRKVTLLTESAGVVDAWANGAGKIRSRLVASTELLSYSQIVLYHGRGRYTVDKADPLRIFFEIRSDLDKLALASYLAELTGELAPHGEEAGTYLRLLLNTLHLLEGDKRPPRLLKALYELRLLTMSGYMPDLVACGECGLYEHDEMYFYTGEGRLLCGGCRSKGSAVGGVRLRPGVLAAMRHIVYSEADKLFGFSLSDQGEGELARICEDYLKYQVEKTFPTLEFYHSIIQTSLWAGANAPAQPSIQEDS